MHAISYLIHNICDGHDRKTCNILFDDKVQAMPLCGMIFVFIYTIISLYTSKPKVWCDVHVLKSFGTKSYPNDWKNII